METHAVRARRRARNEFEVGHGQVAGSAVGIQAFLSEPVELASQRVRPMARTARWARSGRCSPAHTSRMPPRTANIDDNTFRAPIIRF
jgi:hypothetical protein